MHAPVSILLKPNLNLTIIVNSQKKQVIQSKAPAIGLLLVRDVIEIVK